MTLNRTESTTTTETDFSKLEAGAKTTHVENLPQIFEEDDENLDGAAKALKGQDLHFTEEEEKSVLRKIDWRLLPLMAWTCGLQFIDKAAIGNAAVFGMKTDLNLVGTEFSWGVSIFYFGYMLGTYPSLYLMQKLHIGRFIGVMTFCWGVSILGMLGIQNFAGLMVCRFLLGLFEACLSPGFLAITTRWYRQQEQPFRFALWTLTNGLMPIPALVIYYGLGHATGGVLAPWRYIYLLLGLLTVVTGVLCWFLLPNTPADVSWLNARQRAIAVERVARSQTGISNTKFKWSQVREAVLDIRAWLTVFTLFLSQSGGAVTTNFLGLIVAGFGYSQLRSMLLQAPAFAIQAIVCLLVTGLVTYTKFFRNAKQPLLSVASLAVIAGAAVIYSNEPSPQNQYLLLGMLYMIALNNCSFTTIMSVVGTNFAGATKKTTVNGMTFIAYCLLNIVLPQAFLSSEAPTYHTGILVVLCFQAALFVCYWLNWSLMTLENKRRDKIEAAQGGTLTEEERYQARLRSGLKDMTDKENLAFRYAP